MKNVRILVVLLLATVAVASVTGCKKEGDKESKKENYEEKLVGTTWSAKAEGMDLTLSFEKDGKGKIAADMGGMINSSPLSWKLDGKNISVHFNVALMKKKEFNGTFDGKTLVLDGTTFTKK